MFARAVVGSDGFRELPAAAQALYLQLSMAADDEGFLRNARSTARAIGAGARELEELVHAGFLLCFDSGVMLIRHWLVSNAIRADRRRGTTCIAERNRVVLNGNGVYCLRTEAEVSPAVSVHDEEAICPSEAAGQSADGGQLSVDASFPAVDSEQRSVDASFPVADSEPLSVVPSFPDAVSQLRTWLTVGNQMTTKCRKLTTNFRHRLG